MAKLLPAGNAFCSAQMCSAQRKQLCVSLRLSFQFSPGETSLISFAPCELKYDNIRLKGHAKNSEQRGRRRFNRECKPSVLLLAAAAWCMKGTEARGERHTF